MNKTSEILLSEARRRGKAKGWPPAALRNAVVRARFQAGRAKAHRSGALVRAIRGYPTLIDIAVLGEGKAVS